MDKNNTSQLLNAIHTKFSMIYAFQSRAKCGCVPEDTIALVHCSSTCQTWNLSSITGAKRQISVIVWRNRLTKHLQWGFTVINAYIMRCNYSVLCTSSKPDSMILTCNQTTLLLAVNAWFSCSRMLFGFAKMSQSAFFFHSMSSCPRAFGLISNLKFNCATP